MDEGGSVDEASLSEEAPWRGTLGGASLLGPLENMLKSRDTGISLHGGPFPPKGNVVCGGGSYIGEFDR
jgi:hypothetical protein